MIPAIAYEVDLILFCFTDEDTADQRSQVTYPVLESPYFYPSYRVYFVYPARFSPDLV